tara:strand:- start:6442 stop:6630 length:189 start_codon:yes stop_codon:yes gene_type:complete
MIQEELYFNELIMQEAQHTIIMDAMFWVGAPILMMIVLSACIQIHEKFTGGSYEFIERILDC